MSQMLKNIEMMTAAYLEMAKEGKGDFTSDKSVDELVKILNNIPRPDVLKEM
ncbi:hypothetical protein [Gottfriedia solisilvae]|uniref:Uncharacterized protein n=1 Tax=Gottfriedia solisilvae TaxID=1516104 RepID=A0A8J3AKH3_9BACI|nr:hypothetical protein [Gottfriedia solisilvae]GGI11773.1 hypothetical protein GCM10007380_09520 [Gottfriedia solisilvae]